MRRNPVGRKRRIEEACHESGLDEGLVIRFVQREWIVPEESELDDEDLARIRLILELQQDLGVNDEGIDVILRLVDQIHALRALLNRRAA